MLVVRYCVLVASVFWEAIFNTYLNGLSVNHVHGLVFEL